MKTNCKPCITIRDVLKIVWLNSKLFVSNTKRDIQSYGMVNASACELDTRKYGPIPTHNLVQAIRKQAQENHIPTTDEFYDELRKDVKFRFKEEDRIKIEDAFEKQLNKLYENTNTKRSV